MPPAAGRPAGEACSDSWETSNGATTSAAAALLLSWRRRQPAHEAELIEVWRETSAAVRLDVQDRGRSRRRGDRATEGGWIDLDVQLDKNEAVM